MMNPKNNNDTTLLEAIKAGAVRMKPKWKFYAEHILVLASIILIAIALVYLGSLLQFLWRMARIGDIRSFGIDGTAILLSEFPWWHALVVLVGFVALLFVIRRKTHLYRWPLTMTFGLFLVAFVVAVAITGMTRLHDRIADRPGGNPFPVIGGFYERPMARGLVTVGVIKKIKSNSWSVDVVDDENVTVRINDNTVFPGGWVPAQGDIVIILGKRNDDDINAISIHPAPTGYPDTLITPPPQWEYNPSSTREM